MSEQPDGKTAQDVYGEKNSISRNSAHDSRISPDSNTSIAFSQSLETSTTKKK